MIYYFIHIHKCGGLSTLQAIRNLIPKDHIFEINGLNWGTEPDRFQKLNKEKYKLVMGHMFYGYHRFYKQPFKYISIVRHPIQRLISFYNYAFRENLLSYNKYMLENKPSLVDFVKQGLVPGLDNGITRFISGTSWQDAPYGKVNNEIFELAIKNIENNFEFIGLTERFDESLLRIREILGINKYPYYIRTNVTKELKGNSNLPYLKSISSNELEIIDNYIKWDLKLYNYIHNRFNQPLKQIDDKNIVHFRKINSYYKLYYSLVNNKLLIKAKQKLTSNF